MKIARIALLLLLAITPLLSSSPASSLKGTVRDSEGAPIQHAKIAIYSTGGGVRAWGYATTIESGADGTFSIELDPGDYALFVIATAFAPTCTEVQLVDGKAAVYNPRLKLSKFNVRN